MRNALYGSLLLSVFSLYGCSNEMEVQDDGQKPVLNLTTDHIRSDYGREFKIEGKISDQSGIRSIRLECPDLFLDKTIDLLQYYSEPQYEYNLSYAFTLPEELEKTELDKPEEILKSIVSVANHKLIQAAQSDVKLEGMGTTLVIATVIGNTLYFSNVGDSRLYLIGDKIKQLSKDHSLVEEMVRLGGIKAEEAKNHPDKNIITRAMGVKEEVEADIYEYRLKKGDMILMCTDGLSNMVEDEDMFDIVKGARDIVEAVQMLIEKANSNGGRDNIGVVLAEPLADEVSAW